MLDYALIFINTHKIIFYILLSIAVILEGPITILGLSLISRKIGFSFYEVLFFAFLGDFLGDLLHYIIGRFLKKYIIKKDFSVIKKLEKRLKDKGLFTKLFVIKYNPPITSLGLIYLGYIKTNFYDFVKNGLLLSVFNSLFITIVGYNFGYLFINKNDFIFFIVLVSISFVIFYFLLRSITSYIIKKIYEGNS